MVEQSFCHQCTHAGHVPFRHLSVLDPELHGLRRGETQGKHPNGDDETDGSGELRHGVRKEWVTDGHVAFDGEGGDGQDCGVSRCLGSEALKDAEGFAEDVGGGRPNPAKSIV